MVTRTVLRLSVPRSAMRSLRLCATCPSLVRALPALAFAWGERRAGATGSARGEWSVVGEEHRREPCGELVLDVARQHAEEHVRADAVFEAVVDRTDLQRGFHLLSEA